MMNDSKRPIAVFDSGAGGISVLKELVNIMPGENYIYMGDSLNAPYGTKPTDEVCRLTVDNITRLIDMGAKEAVIACNTATSAAVRPLRQLYPEIPVVGIEPAIKPAAIYAKGGKVLVMATKLTLREEKLHALMDKYSDLAEIILLPSSELVEFVESGVTNGDSLNEYLSDILAPYIGGVDAVVLGCTHFPLAKSAIQRVMGDVMLFDGGNGTARQAKAMLKKNNMLSDAVQGEIKFISSIEGRKELYKKLFYASK